MDSRTLLVVLLAAACGVLGWRWLRTGRYRRPDEGGPLPRHLWVAGVAPFVGLVVERGLVDRTWPVLLAPLALALAGLVLAAVDADVHRLPNAITLPLVPVQAVLLTVASATTGDWGAFARAGLAALLVGGGTVLLAFVLFGRSIGMGDAKLMVSIAPTLAWLGWSTLAVGVWLGFVIGGLVAAGLLVTRRAQRSTHLAFGPYLVAGAVLAVALA
ncbi:prepilin peptidase [Janibacter sp. G368]|uniref:prepilin peptidase n=1 Tax=Janibacter sp. G368 TaxID=3420441 RepID=UPI003D08F707